MIHRDIFYTHPDQYLLLHIQPLLEHHQYSLYYFYFAIRINKCGRKIRIELIEKHIHIVIKHIHIVINVVKGQ